VIGNGVEDLFVTGVESYQVWHGVRDGSFAPGLLTPYQRKP
jgi:hypothetical protein